MSINLLSVSTVLVFILSQKCESFLYFAFSDKVQSLVYSTTSKQLLSSGDDCIISFWDMDAKRQEVRILRNINIKKTINMKNILSGYKTLPAFNQQHDGMYNTTRFHTGTICNYYVI